MNPYDPQLTPSERGKIRWATIFCILGMIMQVAGVGIFLVDATLNRDYANPNHLVQGIGVALAVLPGIVGGVLWLFTTPDGLR